jgi:hypothetical protein
MGEGDAAHVGVLLLGPAPAALHRSKFHRLFAQAPALEWSANIRKEVGFPKDSHGFLRLYIDTAPAAAVHEGVDLGQRLLKSRAAFLAASVA